MDQIDLIAPIPQVLSRGFSTLGSAAPIATTTILVLLAVRVAQASVMFTGNTRLPMVAGWDGLLPEWFTRLHARHRTPVNSIVFVGAITFAFSVIGLVGVRKQEAFQLLWNASAIFHALTYLVMFAIPIAGLRGPTRAAPLWLKACTLSVESRLMFAVKLSGLILITNAAGVAIFSSIPSRRRGPDVPAASR